VDRAVAQELAVREAGDRPEHARLLAVAHPRLEPDEVPHLAGLVLLAQLHDRVRLTAGARVAEAHRLHRPEAEGVLAARGQLLDRETAFEVRHAAHAAHVVARVLVRRGERGDEGFVFVSREGRVPVVGALALAVARGLEELLELERVGGDDRRDRVVEREGVAAHRRRDRRREQVRRERAGRDDAGIGEGCGLLAHEGDVGVRAHQLGGALGEHGAVHRERRTAGDARLVGALQEDAAQEPQLGLEQAVRVGGLGALEAVGAHQLGEAVGLVGGGGSHGAHLDQRDAHAALGQGPRGLAPRQPASEHGGGLTGPRRRHAPPAPSSSATARPPRARALAARHRPRGRT
jgi:hypothetical protein